MARLGRGLGGIWTLILARAPQPNARARLLRAGREFHSTSAYVDS
jgi:hypothetical protein